MLLAEGGYNFGNIGPGRGSDEEIDPQWPVPSARRSKVELSHEI